MGLRLVVCADGTWNTPDQESGGRTSPTNVVKIGDLVRPFAGDGTPQIVYYHAGVGTTPGIMHILGGAFGDGIDANIIDCYRFLIDNYAPDAEIFLFGFSRGAYTVRSLAGLLRNSGLLRKEHAGRVKEAYDLYRDRGDDTHPKSEKAQSFRDQYAREVRIKCIGVWDTVGALGVPVGLFKRLMLRKYQFHDVTLSSWVDNAFHALAIDERRKPFAPSIWEPQGVAGQTIEQVWFPGVHSNVGGGYADCGLSDAALQWMIEKARQCGLECDDDQVRSACSPNHEGVMYDSMSAGFRLLGSYERPIGEARKDKAGNAIDTKESLHESVPQRLGKALPQSNKEWRPTNVLKYQSKAGLQ